MGQYFDLQAKPQEPQIPVSNRNTSLNYCKGCCKSEMYSKLTSTPRLLLMTAAERPETDRKLQLFHLKGCDRSPGSADDLSTLPALYGV